MAAFNHNTAGFQRQKHMECDGNNQRSGSGNRACTISAVLCGGSCPYLRKLYRCEKAGTRTEIVCSLCHCQRSHNLRYGAYACFIQYRSRYHFNHYDIIGIWNTESNDAPTLPQEIITAVEKCGFFESIPLWAVTLIGGLFITVLSFILIMTVYGRFFKLYMYTALAPIPLSTFAGEPTQNVGKSFIKSYCAVLLEGAVIVLACIIFSLFASSPPVVNPDAAAVTQVWSYIGELVFNMLVLVGAVKMSDRIIREMMGL